MKIRKKQLLEEIRSTEGNLSHIAQQYGMTYAGVLKRVKSDPDFVAAMEEAKEALLDVAQSQLAQAVRNGSPWAIRFVLATWGRSRGFTTKVLVESESQPKGRVVVYISDNGRRRDAPGGDSQVA